MLPYFTYAVIVLAFIASAVVLVLHGHPVFAAVFIVLCLVYRLDITRR